MNSTDRSHSILRTRALPKTSPVSEVATGMWAKPVYADRKIGPRVEPQAGGPGRGPHHAQIRGRAPRKDTRVLEAAEHGRVAEHQFHGAGQVRGDAIEPGQKSPDSDLVRIETHASDFHQGPAEPAAAQQGRQVEKVAADAAAIGGCGKEPDVARERAEVSGVIGQTLELQSATPRRARPRGGACAPARASWQIAAASACPIVVSPAAVSIMRSAADRDFRGSAASTPRC